MNRMWLLIGILVAFLLMSFSCSKDKSTEPNNPTVPVLTTAAVTAVTQTTAQCGGTVTSDGGANVYYRGVCWSTDSLPTYADMKTADGTGIGTFTSSITGLTAGTHYYVRAYAMNDAGLGYGNVDSFTTVALSVPALTTATVTNITQSTAICGGTVTADGGAAVTARGVCWSTNHTPTIDDSITTDGDGIGSFTSSIFGLASNTTYHIRAYATNSVGTGYGSSRPFTTAPTLIDIDGNTYQTIIIGTQVWMAENLKVTHYRNGNAIPKVTGYSIWDSLTTGAYCEYNNDTNNVAVYGRLYNSYAIKDSRNMAPAGWHVPTDAEWQTLVDYLGGDLVAGGKMKETGTVHWLSPNTGATNESGFCALPGGSRGHPGVFYDLGIYAYVWSSSEQDSSGSYCQRLSYDSSNAFRSIGFAISGMSVRCVKD